MPPRHWVLQADVLLLPGGARGPGFVEIEGDRIARVVLDRHPHPTREYSGCTLAPGFVDLQINGAAGCDFLAPTDSGIAAAHAHLLRTGTVAYLPTLITSRQDRLRAALAFFAERLDHAGPPRILGVHLEGPFLSPIRPGAHPPEHLRVPSVEWIAALIEEFPGLIRLVTLAPELEGAGEVIDYLVSQRVVVSAGHTDATRSQAAGAFDRGVRCATHLFNAMRPYHHREPGVVGAALESRDVVCSIIADHVHLHPAVVDLIVTLKGADHTVLVTDAISAAAAAPGESTLGDRRVRLSGGAPRLDDGTLAGSILTMDQAVRNVAGRWGTEAAACMASATPAGVLDLDQGHIHEGMRADLLVLDAEQRPAAVIVGGTPVIQSN